MRALPRSGEALGTQVDLSVGAPGYGFAGKLPLPAETLAGVADATTAEPSAARSACAGWRQRAPEPAHPPEDVLPLSLGLRSEWRRPRTRAGPLGCGQGNA